MTHRLEIRSLIGIEGVESIQVRADGVTVFAALTDDSRFTVKAFLERQKDKNVRRRNKTKWINNRKERNKEQKALRQRRTHLEIKRITVLTNEYS